MAAVSIHSGPGDSTGYLFFTNTSLFIEKLIFSTYVVDVVFWEVVVIKFSIMFFLDKYKGYNYKMTLVGSVSRVRLLKLIMFYCLAF